MNAITLAFQNTQFDIVDRNGQPWLRVHQIAVALGYSRGDILLKLHARNSKEFTDSMTALVKLPTAGGEQETRIFSLRGAHLLGMMSRTEKAAEFRRWVLDVLDREAQSAPVALPEYITPAQQNALQQIVAQRSGESGGLRAYLWSRFNNHFHLGSYKQLPAAHFDEAKSYLESLPMKNEAKPADPLTAAFLPQDGRYLVTFEHGRASNPLPVARQCYVLDEGQFAAVIREPGEIPLRHIPGIMAACMERLSARLALPA